MIYNDKKTSFHDLVEKDSFVSIYHRNLRFYLFIYLFIYLFNSLFWVDNIHLVHNYTNPNRLIIVRSVNYGIESITDLGPKIWESIIANIKEVDKIERFKSGIKKRKPESCRLSKTYMQATPCFTCFSWKLFLFVNIYIRN